MKTFGLTRLEWAISFAVLLVVGFLVLVPNTFTFNNKRIGALNHIGNNLRMIEGAKEQWALENRKTPQDNVSLSALTAYLKNNQVPKSVAGETYTVTTVGELTTAT
ncbi:MAG: hypothetical protein H7Y43_05620, partial [Akkermansiaceae bacterium]|nr:hypothetical protein [Verrucomicrobiales bacterium]